MVNLGLGILIWMIVVPFLLGNLILGLFHRKQEGMALDFLIGYLTMFAVCELIAVPLIQFKTAFHIFVWVLEAIYGVLSLMAVLLYGKDILAKMKGSGKHLIHQPWTLYAAAAAVAFQAYMYFNYMVTNLDDSFYVAIGQAAIETDTMYLVSAYTGRAVKRFNLRYVLSPFSMLQAFYSRCMGISVSAFAHTILSPMLVILAYFDYYCLGKVLFSPKALLAENGGKEVTQRQTLKMTGLFVLLISAVNVTSFYCIRNQGSVLLVRIWQGKATLAAVLIPFIFYLCYKMYLEPEEKGNTIILLITSTASCLVTSMGIVLPPVMLGIFALLFGVLKKNWKYFGKMVLACVPCVGYGVLYIILNILKV